MFTRFFNRAKWDRERARELEGYVEVETQENIARGMTPDEARSAAHRKLGNPTLIREEIYRDLGLRTINPTKIEAQFLRESIERED